jgi:hypothetical protein
MVSHHPRFTSQELPLFLFMAFSRQTFLHCKYPFTGAQDDCVDFRRRPVVKVGDVPDETFRNRPLADLGWPLVRHRPSVKITRLFYSSLTKSSHISALLA